MNLKPLPLTGIIAAQVFSLAAILLALGSEVGLDRTTFTRLENEAEDLFPCPQGNRLKKNKEGY